ncbi:MAG: glycosyltransferase family 2 protein [Bacteroidales bacterium]|jgi:glycosyltransferase involved in cell wall biosynthesis|nr:glycosyltransferase family 2 protein [Bacteroidales bacterium]MDN5349858.1 hypothetical protein [Bacteroidales bacterium]
MEKLSVSIITLNEEKNIRRCLESVADLADEIVVVDSFSKDKTEVICREFGVLFSTHPFEGYIEQKNVALDLCAHTMVLSLDADEALSDELKSAIMAEKKMGFPAKAYTMNRLTNYCGQWIHHCGWYPDRKLRLFDKRLGKWGGQNPHDKFEFLQEQQPKQLSGDLLHYSYYSTQEHYRQARHFADIAAQAMQQKNNFSSLPHAVVKTVAKFIRNYIIKRGFLDGYNGFIICKISAIETWWKYRRLNQLNRQQ